MAQLWSKLKRSWKSSKGTVPGSMKIPNLAMDDDYSISNFLEWYERRPSDWPTANDIASIHKILTPFLQEFDSSAVVYVHGSYARGLQKATSDINLYIPSHNRKAVEELWSQVRRGLYPDADETIETYLRDLLGKEVTLCCSDDPWLWAREDVRIQVFPALEEGISNAQKNVPSKRDTLLQNMRKCWYIVSRFETDEAWKWRASREDTVDVSGATIMDAKAESTRVKLYEAKTAVGRISDLLAEFSPKVWRREVPELAVTTLITDFKHLDGETYRAFHVEGDTSEALWETLVGHFRRRAREIHGFKASLFPQA